MEKKYDTTRVTLVDKMSGKTVSVKVMTGAYNGGHISRGGFRRALNRAGINEDNAQIELVKNELVETLIVWKNETTPSRFIAARS